MLLDVVHPELNQEITAIGGYYLFLKEVSMRHQGRTVLYLVGCALFNSTCCGTGGISFARVQGFLHRYQYKKDLSGAWVSRVEPITDSRSRQDVERIIQQRESVHQVEFL